MHFRLLSDPLFMLFNFLLKISFPLSGYGDFFTLLLTPHLSCKGALYYQLCFAVSPRQSQSSLWNHSQGTLLMKALSQM